MDFQIIHFGTSFQKRQVIEPTYYESKLLFLKLTAKKEDFPKDLP